MAQHPSTAQTLPAQSQARLPYVPGLDGVRALAVIAVLLYHADLPIEGGFLGVETFFVLSGFLITALLLAEWDQSSQIDLRGFWLRRARRLLPALFVMLLGTVIIAALVIRGDTSALRADLLASLGYVMNWRLILSGQSYFDPLVRPSLLQHLWSLAVEEQFYLLWPLIFVAGMRLLRARRMLLLILAAALGSAALMAVLYQPGLNPSRVYYGTDTRASGVLIGAALAFAWRPIKGSPVRGSRLGWLADGAGLLALAGLLACFVLVSERHRLLYQGGFALIDVLTVIVIAALTHPGARLVPGLLGWQPLRWIGMRSYGLYLWHWPIFMVTRPYVDLPLDGLPLLALRLAIVGVLVELSYRYVEMPIRHGVAWERWSRRWSAIGLAQGGWGPRSRQVVSSLRWAVLLVPILVLLSGGMASRRNTPEIAAQPALPDPTAVQAQIETTTAPPAAQLPRATALSGAMVLPDDPMPAPTPVAPQPAAPTSVAAQPAAPSASAPLDPALIAQLQAVLDATVERGASPGAVLSIRIPGYEPWTGASGLADRREQRPMQPDSLIHISSITKMFTAVVVLQLVEEGKLDLDTPISTWLPEIVPLAERTTVRQLLSHRSGIFDYLEDSRFFIEAYQNPERTYAPAELIGMVDQYGAAFEPGTEGAWKYSSTNYAILGMLVEQVTGKPLAEEMRRRIFEPLALTHTFFAPYEPVQGAVAEGYIDASDRADVSMTFVFATGNLISAADDLRRFADGLFGGQLLKPESLGLMTTTIYTGGAYLMPELEYGLGVMRANLAVGAGPDGAARPENLSAVLGHIGGVAGFRSAVWQVPESNITIALGLNQANIDPNLLARDALDVILAWQDQ